MSEQAPTPIINPTEQPRINPDKSPEQVAEQFARIIEASGKLALRVTEEPSKDTGRMPSVYRADQKGSSKDTTIRWDSGEYKKTETTRVEGSSDGWNGEKISPSVETTNDSSHVWSRTGLSEDGKKIVVKSENPGKYSTVHTRDATPSDIIKAVDEVKRHNGSRRRREAHNAKYPKSEIAA